MRPINPKFSANQRQHSLRPTIHQMSWSHRNTPMRQMLRLRPFKSSMHFAWPNLQNMFQKSRTHGMSDTTSSVLHKLREHTRHYHNTNFNGAPCHTWSLPNPDGEAGSSQDQIKQEIAITARHHILINNEPIYIYHQNVGRFKTLFPVFATNVENCLYDIIHISETNFDVTVTDPEIQIPGYSCYRNDRDLSIRQDKQSGGGLLIYCRSSLNHSPIVLPPSTYVEWMGIQLTHNGNTTIFINVYAPPLPVPKQVILNELELLVTHTAAINTNVVYSGDFNLPGLRWVMDQDIEGH